MRGEDSNLQLFLRYRAALIEYATPIVGDRTQAEDVVQEAYLRFTPRDSGSMVIKEPRAYLYRIVRNLARDVRRRILADRRRDAAHLILVESLPLAPSPEERTLNREELHQIATFLDELSPDVRKAFEMYRFGDYTLQQIADHFGVTSSTAGRWIQEALKHVVRRLGRAQRSK